MIGAAPEVHFRVDRVFNAQAGAASRVAQMPGIALLLLYAGVVGTPLVLAWSFDLPLRPLRDEVSSALALLAFAALLAEFALSGRFRLVTGRIGSDRTMRLHQVVGRVILAAALLHPFLYSLPVPVVPLAWDTTASEHLRLDGRGLVTGALAWCLLGTLILSAIWRDAVPYSYEGWRLAHGVGAVAVAGLTAVHAFDVGRYSAYPALGWYWQGLLGLAAFSLLYVYVLAPMIRWRTPFEVISTRRIAERTWELVVARKDGGTFRFAAGQFVWLSLARHPFTLRENPFSIASAPAQSDRVEFVIKEAGDFTRSLGSVRPGQSAWLEGPHGALTLPEAGATGVGLIAGGVGIAPLLSIWRQLAEMDDPRPVALLYGNRAASQIVYPEELDRLAARSSASITHVLQEPETGWSGQVGWIGPEAIAAAFDAHPGSDRWTYLLCGPPAMLDAARAALLARGVPAARILSERFVYD